MKYCFFIFFTLYAFAGLSEQTLPSGNSSFLRVDSSSYSLPRLSNNVSALPQALPPLLLQSGIINTAAESNKQVQLLSLTSPMSNQLLRVSQPSIGQKPFAVLVQCSSRITEDMKVRLHECGALIHSYVPQNGLIISLLPESLDAVSHLPFVSWIGSFKQLYKVSPSLSAALSGQTLQSEHLSPLPPDLVVYLFDTNSISDIELLLDNLSGHILHVSVHNGSAAVRVSAPDLNAVISSISSLPSVEWIEPYSEPGLCNDVAASSKGINVSKLWNTYGLTGDGEIIGHADTGIDTGNYGNIHPDFAGKLRAAHGLGRLGDWSDHQGHGTHTAGSIIGTGAALGSRQFKGIAHGAMLIHQSLSDSSDSIGAAAFDLYEIMYQAYIGGARIHSDSWGSEAGSAYTWYSKMADMFVWDHKDMLLVFPAGNSGRDPNRNGVIGQRMLNAPGTAKNVLTVGAAETSRLPGTGGRTAFAWADVSLSLYPVFPIAQDLVSSSPDPFYRGMTAFSSRGPTADGRIKPDVVAPGTDIISCRSRYPTAGTAWGEYNSYYTFSGGTSMATPIAAGAAALVRQFFRAFKNIPNPSAALIKATLINGARSLSPGQYGFGSAREIPPGHPNSIEGFGMLDIEHSLFPPNGFSLYPIDGDACATGMTNVYQIVSGPPSMLSITLAYSDYPGSLISTVQLVNDLDLVVITPDNSVCRSISKAVSDRINNIEHIQLACVPPGTTTILVIGYNVPFGPQPYALVARQEQPALPVLSAHVLSYAPMAVRNATPVSLDAHITTNISGLQSVELLYRMRPGVWISRGMLQTGAADNGFIFNGDIPIVQNGITVDFFVRALANDTYRASSQTNSYTVNPHVIFVSKNGSQRPPYDSLQKAFTNLQTAVDYAPADSIIRVDHGVYSGPITIRNGITVRSTKGAGVTTIDGRNATQCVIMNGPDTTLDGFTVQRAFTSQTGGGIKCYNGSRVINCIIKNNYSKNRGGGIFCDYGGFISNCVIQGNTALFGGGGVYCDRGGTVVNCIIKKNTTDTSFGEGGGILCLNGGSVTDCIIEKNSAGNTGGGLWSSGTAFHKRCSVVKNSAGQSGGGVYVEKGGSIEDFFISRNKSSTYAGGLYANANTYIGSCSIEKNRSIRGGGIFCNGGIIGSSRIIKNKSLQGGGVEILAGSVTNCYVSHNSSGEGGGIYVHIKGTVYDSLLERNKAKTAGGLYLYQQAVASNCVIRDNIAQFGGGLACGERAEGVHLTVSANRARRFGGGVYMIPFRNDARPSIIHKSMISDNTAGKKGGGIFALEQGILRNCIVSANSSRREGGGIYLDKGGKIENCTIIRNAARRQGGGISGGNYDGVFNSIVYYNLARFSNNIYSVGLYTPFYNCCSLPLPAGRDNISREPVFVNPEEDFHQSDSSPCINTGTNLVWMFGSSDFDGETRVLRSFADIGCFEFNGYTDTDPPTLTISWPPDWSIFPAQSNNVPVQGTVSDDLGILSVSHNSRPVSFSSQSGWYDYAAVKTGTNLLKYIARDTDSHAVTAQVVCVLLPPISIPRIAGVTNYVSPAGTHVWPYTNWVTAATNIYNGVYAAGNGNTVLVDAGSYNLVSQLVISTAISLKSRAGPDSCIIIGNGSKRCVQIDSDSVSISGFTIRNGRDARGGGIYSEYDCFIDNCIVRDNVADINGGGLYLGKNAVITNSLIKNNRAKTYGGGILVLGEALVTGCTVEYNTSQTYGGGIFCDEFASVEFCTIRYNSATNEGGGLTVLSLMPVKHCTIVNNYAPIGGGVRSLDYTTLLNCTITGNSAREGGGVHTRYGRVRNCLISANSALQKAGGLYCQYGGYIQNCTIVNNTSRDSVGGLYCENGGHILNCIVYFNKGLTYNNYNVSGTTVTFDYSCTKPLASGRGTTDADPLLVNYSAGNYRLFSTSPCVDSGAVVPWMYLAQDLGGTARIRNGRPDMGAYEYTSSAISLTADTTAGPDPLAVGFSARLNDYDPGNLWFVWDTDNNDLPDYTGFDATDVMHIYTNPGIYTVSVSVFDDSGWLASAVRTNYIDVLPEPVLSVFLILALFLKSRDSR